MSMVWRASYFTVLCQSLTPVRWESPPCCLWGTVVPTELVKQAAFTPSTVSGLRGWNLHPEYWLQIPSFTTSWQPARSTCTIRADNRCIWNAANTSWLMWYYYYASIHPFLKSINRQSASCVPGPVVGPTFYTDFTLVWGDNVKNGNVLKTIPDHYMCQGCHRCDEKQVNGNYRE